MNKYLYIIFVFSGFCFQKYYCQSVAQLKEQLTVLNDSINSLNKDLRNLRVNDTLNKVDIENQKKTIFLIRDSISEYNQVIHEINNLWLKDLLYNKYQINDNYLLTKDFTKEDEKLKLTKIDACAKSLIAEGVKGDTLIICNKVIEFHKIYFTLTNIQENIVTQKYDSSNIQKALYEIEASQKQLDKSSKLYLSSIIQKDLLMNYKSRCFDLKIELDKLKKMEQTAPFTIKKYNDLLIDLRFVKYDYLVKIIKEMKNNVNSYTDNDLDIN